MLMVTKNLRVMQHLKMHKAMRELNMVREEEAKTENKKFLELKIGIGLNTGGCVEHGL